jgi:Phage protein Gp138 N-terminal domain
MDTTFGLNLSERLGNPADQWSEALDAFARSLRVAVPAVVTAFHSDVQTVEAQPLVREAARIKGVPTPKSLPLLVDVPVLLPRAGAFTLTFPIVAGDECLVLFSDTCFDAWWANGGQQNQMSQRRHSLSNGFALVGVWNKQRAIPSYSTTSVQLRNADGSTRIEVAGTAVNVQAQTVDVHAYGTATVRSDSVVNVTASSSVHIAGNGSTTIEGKDWLTHKHTGVATGGGTSGPVL